MSAEEEALAAAIKAKESLAAIIKAKEELLALFRKTPLELLLLEFELGYRKGRKESIIDAIAFSLRNDAEIPRWAKYAFLNAYFKNRPRSWDDVFGRPLPKGARVKGQRERRTTRRLFTRVRKLLQQGVGVEAALRQVSKLLGISYPSARAIWYDPEARHIYWLQVSAATDKIVPEDELFSK